MAEVKRVKVSALKGSKHNPPSRVDYMIGQLERSISKIGLIYPIVVTKANVVIDGHRRLQAVRNLEWEDVPVLVAEGEEALIYAEVNANSKVLTGNQTLSVWLKNPEAVTTAAGRRFTTAEAQVGRPFLERLVSAGMSVRVIRTARELARYCEDEDPRFLRRAAAWLLRWRNNIVVRAYIRMQQPARVLHRAVLSGKPLKVRFVSA